MSNKKIYFIIICIVFIILLFLGAKPIEKKAEDESIITSTEDIIKEPVEEIVEEKLKVDIKGEVKKPGVYSVDKNNRIIDVITLAGGLSKNADTSFINLSKKLEDEMVIIIYSSEEIENFKESNNIKYEIIEIPCTCPDNQNDACINEKQEETETKININEATIDELMTIPGIGESKAQSIIEYRNIKPFENIENIKEVSGIGEVVFEKIKDHITV